MTLEDMLAERAALWGGAWEEVLRLREWPQGQDPYEPWTQDFEFDAYDETLLDGVEHFGVRQILMVERLFGVTHEG